MKKASLRAFKDIDLVPTTNAMWEAAWNIVANCNNLIQQVEGADTTLFYKGEEERNMIWGEAIALRAYVQFDFYVCMHLLRPPILGAYIYSLC